MIGRIYDFLEKIVSRLHMPCVFHQVTGLYCPGCGGTRAVISLLHGDLGMSFQYHPLVLYVAAALALEGLSWAAARIFHRPRLHFKRYGLVVALGAVLVVANWLFKNYMLVFQGVDLLPLLAK